MKNKYLLYCIIGLIVSALLMIFAARKSVKVQDEKLYKVTVLGKSETIQNSKYPRVDSWVFVRLEDGRQIQVNVTELTYFNAKPGMTMWFYLTQSQITGRSPETKWLVISVISGLFTCFCAGGIIVNVLPD